MARPSEKSIEYKQRAQNLDWADLSTLWDQIKARSTPHWDDGTAFEHLVVRAFELSGLRVEYPYHVPPGGNPIEQIDGIIFLDHIPFLIECKDWNAVDVETIAKLRNQILRRPPLTMGCVFVTGRFTVAALILADFTVPHQITLWASEEIEFALADRNFKDPLVKKFQHLCLFGMTDHSPNYKTVQVNDE